MIILIHGDDTYSARQYLNTTIKQFKIKHDSNNLNLSKIDGSKASFKDISKEFSSIPFLGKKRMVVIEDFLQKFKNKKIKKPSIKNKNIIKIPRQINKDLSEDIKFPNGDPKKIIEHILKVEDSIVVFFETNDLKKNEFLKILSKKKKDKIHIYNYPLLCGYDLKKWICAKAKNLKVDIEPSAIEMLIQNIGGNLWQMENELQKLSAYVLEKKLITYNDIILLVPNKLEDNIFKLTDALGNKDTKICLQIFREMLELDYKKVDYILIMLVRQFRILIQVKDFVNNKQYATRNDIVNKFKLHSFVASKSLAQAKKFQLDELKKIYKKILEFESKQKTGYIKPALMFDLLAMKL